MIMFSTPAPELDPDDTGPLIIKHLHPLNRRDHILIELKAIILLLKHPLCVAINNPIAHLKVVVPSILVKLLEKVLKKDLNLIILRKNQLLDSKVFEGGAITSRLEHVSTESTQFIGEKVDLGEEDVVDIPEHPDHLEGYDGE